jgi:hypothetical protein
VAGKSDPFPNPTQNTKHNTEHNTERKIITMGDFLLLLLLSTSVSINAFMTSLEHVAHSSRLFSTLAEGTDLSQDKLYTKAFEVIDACASSAQPSDDLYESVRYIDKNAYKFYCESSSKQQLWDRCKGSWKLQLATGPPSSKEQPTFKSVPIFAYAMIDERNFGNGVGLNQDLIILSLLGNHYFNEKKRQMGIGIDDMYLFSSKVTNFLPGFITYGMGLGKKPEDFTGRSRMPAFTMIGASDKSMIARGGSGGIAIWTKLEKDIRPAAYGKEN